MEQTSGNPKKTGKSGVPVWVVIALVCVIAAMAVSFCLILLPRCYTISCEKVGDPSAEATAVVELPTQAPDTPVPAATEAPAPTPEPTEETTVTVSRCRIVMP